MVPVIGSAISLGLRSHWQKKWFRIAIALLGLYAVVFSMVISWAQVLMFSGIIYKSGNNKFYQFPDHLPPYFGIPNVLTNLSALVYPKFGVFCWLAGGVLFISGLILGWRLIGKSVKIRAKQNL
jgi:cellulose synthase/poly-beta-1,6-N-acetylglucosamine synthase-like glycosyltransferase